MNLRFPDKSIQKTLKQWPIMVKKYMKPDNFKSITQTIITFVGLFGLWFLAYKLLNVHWSLSVLVTIFSGFFMGRMLIIQHDCGHFSYFKSKTANHTIGTICSLFTFLPYNYWRKVHNFHHAHTGQLEEEVRDIGSIFTYNVSEWAALSKWKKMTYHVYRNPIVLFIIGPLVHFLFQNRIFFTYKSFWKKEGYKILITDIALVAFYGGLMYLMGVKAFFLVIGLSVLFYSVFTVWMFYVQHQHEETYRQWSENWEYLLAQLQGSSFYKLPKIAHWLTGNIGYHHIHHLCAKIPNYNLVQCHNENPILSSHTEHLTFWKSLTYMDNFLWDEIQNRMITWREYKALYA